MAVLYVSDAVQLNAASMLTVNEIFHSIQGESTRAGRPCVFVRLTACDLRCSWCDTPYAFHEGRKMSVDEVVSDVAAFECPVVEITGGEPLLQKDVYPLMRELLARGHTVLIETGGHRSLAQVPSGVVRIMDVKCPGERRVGEKDWSNLDRLTPTTRSSSSCRTAPTTSSRATSSRGTRSTGGAPRSVLARARRAAARELAEWVLADRLPVRVQLQVHKYIWSRGSTEASDVRSRRSRAAERRSRFVTPPRRCRRRTASSCTP